MTEYPKGKLLKLVPRSAILPVLLTILCLLPLRAAHAQVTNSKFDANFAHAKELETTRPDKALDEYDEVKKQTKDKELEAEALLRGAQYAADPARWGKISGKTPGEGENAAHDRLKELENKHADSIAAKAELQPNFVNDVKGAEAVTHFQTGATNGVTFRKAIEERLDKRNSHTLSYRIVDGLVRLTGRVPAFSYWFALVLIAVIVKGLTMPLTLKTYKSQREMQRISPQLKALQERYKGKPELQEKTMAFYKEHGVNPFATCLPLLIQTPFMIWIYYAIRQYEFHFANGKFLWVGSSLAAKFPMYIGKNLGDFDYVLLVLYAASNYLTLKLTPATDPAMAQQQKTMSVVTTVMMFIFFVNYRFPSAFVFYWLVLNIISAWQQYIYIYKPNKATVGMSPITVGSSPVRSASSGTSAAVSTAGNNGSSATAVRPSSAPRPRPKRKNKR